MSLKRSKGIDRMKILIHTDIDAARHSTRRNRRLSPQEIKKRLVRCRSSNVWAYTYDNSADPDGKIGTVYIQFKNAYGGPGDIYRYYDVPLHIYKKFISGTSKGHGVWQYFRNNFKYSKLTGDKRGRLKNAVN